MIKDPSKMEGSFVSIISVFNKIPFYLLIINWLLFSGLLWYTSWLWLLRIYLFQIIMRTDIFNQLLHNISVKETNLVIQFTQKNINNDEACIASFVTI
jgi:hypothetical protein